MHLVFRENISAHVSIVARDATQLLYMLFCDSKGGHREGAAQTGSVPLSSAVRCISVTHDGTVVGAQPAAAREHF